MKNTLLFYCLIGIGITNINAQTYPQPSLNSGQIKLALKKLNTLGSVLYLAAHPDDENTRFLSYYANEAGMQAAYLSLTRGDGGQNLVGKEVRELLGIIRTQELLAARRKDGAIQMFTRANDFGYSKNADETLQIWNKDQVLADVVWAIRKFRPDVIVTRFPSDKRAGHGHHTASALLGEQAFELAANHKQFPHQLKKVNVWQPKRLLWNTHPFWFSRDTNLVFKEEEMIKIDLGVYNPLLGQSYGEIASISRTMHKSQGFGSRLRRGSQDEYFYHIKGDKAKDDLFDGIDTSWGRVKKGKKVGQLLSRAYDEFKMENPESILPLLIEAHLQLNKLKQSNYWVRIKKIELENVILQCAAVWVEVTNKDYSISVGDSLSLTANIIKRSDITVKLNKIDFDYDNLNFDSLLSNNIMNSFKIDFKIPDNLKTSQPYWLKEKETKGMFTVNEQSLIGNPENKPPIIVKYSLTFSSGDNQINITTTTPIFYKWVDRVDGELYRSLEIRPIVTVNLEKPVYLFFSNKEKEIKVLLKSHKENLEGKISLEVPEGWNVYPQEISFRTKDKYQEENYIFKVSSSLEQSKGIIKAKITVNEKTYFQSLKTIDYKHIPKQTLFPRAESKIVKLDIQYKTEHIAYIMGAGDAIPEALTEIGFHVDILNDDQIKLENLKKYDALITGVRAYNTNKRLKFQQEDLLEYVNQGGNMIVQYNTSFRTVTNQIGPYPLKLSRDRVTVEEAPVTFLDPNHPLLNFPNKITQNDFEGWVQERGLYFPNEWDQKYETVISLNDPGEMAKKGAILTTKYGKGTFIYTGLSMFRELPAGVAGAYRLFVNMIDYRNENIPLEKREK